MRFRLSPLGLIVIPFIAMVLSACPPAVKYPQCATDADCKKDAKGAAIDEYCVNKQCQECRDDSHCDAGEMCSNGRCETKPECTKNEDCGDNKICEAQKCVDAECQTDEDCEAGHYCGNYKCIAGCATDQHCGAGMRCEAGSCVDAIKISAACRPMDPSTGDSVALQVVQFDFDKADLRVDARQALDQNAECLREAPEVQVVLEGHCDERGTQEYNLALGDRRANTVKSYLRNLGIDTSRLRTVSKGKNEPVCHNGSESCHERNRRVEFLQTRGTY